MPLLANVQTLDSVTVKIYNRLYGLMRIFDGWEKRVREGWKREVLKNLVGVWKKNHSLPYLIEGVNISFATFKVEKLWILYFITNSFLYKKEKVVKLISRITNRWLVEYKSTFQFKIYVDITKFQFIKPNNV